MYDYDDDVMKNVCVTKFTTENFTTNDLGDRYDISGSVIVYAFLTACMFISETM